MEGRPPSRVASTLVSAAVVAMCVLWGACSGPRGTASFPGAGRPLVLAHYMPWFSAKPISPDWGWHWTMGAFDPDRPIAGRRPIASHYTPLIGPYDSADPDVIEYHLLLMKLAGIDGVIADWYGRSDVHDYASIHRNTTLLFAAAERLGLKYCVCYEDRAVTELASRGALCAPNRADFVRTEIDWLRRTWFTGLNHVRIDNRPLLLSFGESGLTDGEWSEVFNPGSDRPLYLSEHRVRAAADGAFDWPIPDRYPASLHEFAAFMRAGGRGIPVAFPRFHDFYEQAGVHASWGSVPDDEGRTWISTLVCALGSGAPVVQIATWNDWGEGTMIEPSIEFGYRDLETLRQRRTPAPGTRSGPGPDDLRLPHRLLSLRRAAHMLPGSRAGLDLIARDLALGNTNAARRSIERLESAAPRSPALPRP